jgi:hypothetical protein
MSRKSGNRFSDKGMRNASNRHPNRRRKRHHRVELVRTIGRLLVTDSSPGPEAVEKRRTSL